MIFGTLVKWKLRLPKDDASKHDVGVLTIYKILLIYICVVHLFVWIIIVQDAWYIYIKITHYCFGVNIRATIARYLLRF